MNLLTVSGVSSAKRERLENAGIDSVECLAWSNPLRLRDVEGCSPSLVIQAQKVLYDEGLWHTENLMEHGRLKRGKCQFCGREETATNLNTMLQNLRSHQQFCDENPEPGLGS